MKYSVMMRLGAVTLALLTLAAVVFCALNFQQRKEYKTPDDGVSWLDTAQGIQAWHVASDSPAAKAGIREGDYVTAINEARVRRAVQVTQRLWRLGVWT